MIRLAMPDSDMKKRLQEAQMMQMQAPNYAGQNLIQTAPTQPTVMQQAGDMVVDRAISKGMEQVGKEGLKAGLSAAGTAAGSTGLTVCTPCNTGWAAAAGSAICALCSPGKRWCQTRQFRIYGYHPPLSFYLQSSYH